VLKRFLRRRVTSAAPIWRGVYRRFGDIPRSGAVFSSAVWIDLLARELQEVRAREWTEEFVLEHEILRFLVDVVRRGSTPLRIVDFGGGLGASYAYLRHCCPDAAIQHAVVETSGVVARGRAMFADDPSVTFAEAVGPAHQGADIVFVKSALQYLEECSAVTRSLLELRPRFLLLEKLSAVEGEAFGTEQVNLPGVSIPYWFVNGGEVIRMAAEQGYRCVLHRWLPRVYDPAGLPLEPPGYHASTLLFAEGALPPGSKK
jgi:putative methyltransferase (TIGR04325 family)